MKNSNTLRNTLSVITIIFAILSIYFLRGDIKAFIQKVRSSGQTVQQNVGQATSAVLSYVKALPSLPGPLEVLKKNTGTETALTLEGIISATNTERINNGLPALTENQKLDTSALVKTKDMFARQYFEHMSPDGKSVSNLVTDAGYDYIVIGENLALGNFTSSNDVVAAWMASPGHRANILNARFTEIGVGVMQGTYNGNKVWIAVQHFGLPRSACPMNDTVLENEIKANQSQTTTDDAILTDLKNQIDQEGDINTGHHNELIKQYNALVPVYNKLVSDTQEKVTRYNAEVRILNACLEGK